MHRQRRKRYWPQWIFAVNNWIQQLQQLLQQEERVVIVTVASVKGSTPREPGARMLVSASEISNTIGGGHLELKSIQIARNMLANSYSNELQRFSLGAGLGQCCGGVVTVFFELVTKNSSWVSDLQELVLSQQDCVQIIPTSLEDKQPRLLVTLDSTISAPAISEINNSLISTARLMLNNLKEDQSKSTSIINFKSASGQQDQYIFDPVIKSNFNIFLFGAGHVGQALIKLLSEQSCQVTWVDTRDNQLPSETAQNITAICTDVPEAIINEAPTGSYFLVMTHDHSLDQKLSEFILRKDDFSYFGLIGSKTKRKRFEHRLLRRDIGSDNLKKMTCPIGINGITSKHPAAIAVAVMAELLQNYEKEKYITNNNHETGQLA